MKIGPSKILKTAVACCLSIAAAMALGLQNSASAGIITLLSLQETKKETLTIAFKRFAAFCAALLIAFVSFSLIGYNVWAFGVYLLLFVLVCQQFDLMDTVPVCSVLITHFWLAKAMPPALVLNEALLLVVGAGVGIGFNLFMPRRVSAIRQEQRRIEAILRTILHTVSEVILKKKTMSDLTSSMEELKEALASARKKAYQAVNNTLTLDMRYYVQYVDLRVNQYAILEQMRSALPRLKCVPAQAHLLADFLKRIASSLHECNNAALLLQESEKIRQLFRESELPDTREMFEARATLFQIFHDVEYFLLLKKAFIDSLTKEQREFFWSQAFCTIPEKSE